MKIWILVAALAIIGSFYAQYGLGIVPCNLCMYQRYLWFVVAITALASCKYAIFQRAFPIIVVAGIALSTYHIGVISGIFQDRCQYHKPGNIEEYRAMLKSGPASSCSTSGWTPAGLPAPVWNIILLLLTQWKAGFSCAEKLKKLIEVKKVQI